ncbi:MAG: hypothetical protein IT160_17020 [Bryobacterales bacterium]|nr:hypothetical protein [Bryobacterales bacterium]
MVEFFRRLFQSDFMPHGHCYFWRPEIVWLHVSSDAVTAFSYYLIPFGLVYLVKKRKDLEFQWMFLLFGLFILTCGTTHLMSIWTLWHGTYRLEGVIKALTALASLPTAILLYRQIPGVLELPSPSQLKTANGKLAQEILVRKDAEDRVRALNAELEQRVRDRTRELENTVRALRETNQALTRANENLNQFAYSASHDLREPLRMVSSYVKLLESRYGPHLDPAAREFIGYAIEGSHRMQNLLHDLIEYTRAGHESGRPLQAIHPQTVLQAVLQDLEPQIRECHAIVDVGELPDVLARAAPLGQVFQNLLANALKYQTAGEAPRIFVSATAGDTEVTFCVRDSGIGIDPQYHRYIFGLFRRLHTQSQYSGTGMGLAICERVVEQFGGRIWVESEPGLGASFFFTLPRA